MGWKLLQKAVSWWANCVGSDLHRSVFMVWCFEKLSRTVYVLLCLSCRFLQLSSSWSKGMCDFSLQFWWMWKGKIQALCTPHPAVEVRWEPAPVAVGCSILVLWKSFRGLCLIGLEPGSPNWPPQPSSSPRWRWEKASKWGAGNETSMILYFQFSFQYPIPDRNLRSTRLRLPIFCPPVFHWESRAGIKGWKKKNCVQEVKVCSSLAR